MYVLTKGNMRLVLYNQMDVMLYKKSGWKLLAGKKEKPLTANRTTSKHEKNNKRRTVN